MGRLVDLAERSHVLAQNGNGRTPDVIHPHLRRWHVEAASYLASGDYALPVTANVRWTIVTEPLSRTWCVVIEREGWTHSVTLRGGEKTSGLEVLNELLAASFGVPA